MNTTPATRNIDEAIALVLDSLSEQLILSATELANPANPAHRDAIITTTKALYSMAVEVMATLLGMDADPAEMVLCDHLDRMMESANNTSIDAWGEFLSEAF